MKEDRPNNPTGPEHEAPDKKKWERPRMQSGQLFEANTVSCAKQPGNPGCIPGPVPGLTAPGEEHPMEMLVSVGGVVGSFRFDLPPAWSRTSGPATIRSASRLPPGCVATSRWRSRSVSESRSRMPNRP